MFGLGVGELVAILGVAVLLFGPKKIPQLAKGMGEALREFRNSTETVESDKVKTPKDT